MWKRFDKKLPPIETDVLVYKQDEEGGFDIGIYIGTLVRGLESIRIVIKDSCTNTRNFRPTEEFSHWTYLPSDPEWYWKCRESSKKKNKGGK